MLGECCVGEESETNDGLKNPFKWDRESVSGKALDVKVGGIGFMHAKPGRRRQSPGKPEIKINKHNIQKGKNM